MELVGFYGPSTAYVILGKYEKKHIIFSFDLMKDIVSYSCQRA